MSKPRLGSDGLGVVPFNMSLPHNTRTNALGTNAPGGTSILTDVDVDARWQNIYDYVYH